VTAPAEWLRMQLQERHLTQSEVAVYIGVSAATFGDILNWGLLRHRPPAPPVNWIRDSLPSAVAGCYPGLLPLT